MSTEKENLEKFISHCQDLQHEDHPSGDGFSREFKNLRETQAKDKDVNKYSSEEGKKPDNLKKNRYKDILPYDYKRVVLDASDEETDYINASFIEGVNGGNDYIASQGPLPHTVNEFWRMLWQFKIEIVFMACREEEGEPKKAKCQKYWTESGESKEFGNITVTLEQERMPIKDFYERKICAKYGGQTHSLTQLHYIGWPDHGVPDHPTILNIMISHMRATRQKPDIPIVVHCSAGCGRTGTICAIDYSWNLLNQGKIGTDFCLYEIIAKFREQRQSMVQTPDQYELVHTVMENLFQKWIANYDGNNMVVTDQLYSNIETDNELESIYVNTEEDENEEENELEDNIYTECGESVAVISAPVLQPTTKSYTNINVKKDQTKPNTVSYDNVFILNDKSQRINSEKSASNSDVTEDEMYTVVNSNPKIQTEVEKPVTRFKEIPSLPPRVYGQEEVEKPVTRFKEIPSLPPRVYGHNEIKSSAATKPGQEAQQPTLKPQFPVKRSPQTQNYFESGTTQHPATHAHRNMIRPLVGDSSYNNQPPKHKTVINVLQPSQFNMRLKVGGKELVLPASVPRNTTYVPQQHTVSDRIYYEQSIGYNHRYQHPKGVTYPRHFELNKRRDNPFR